MNIAIFGYGKMGHLVEEVAKQKGIGVPVTLDKENEGGREITKERLANVDVCIDFSLPDAVIDNVKACAAIGKNIVVGATGWYQHLDEVRTIVNSSDMGMVYGANFSIGMNLFFKIVDEAAKIVSRFKQYDPFIHEAHHKRKLDAPSGTAIELERVMKSVYQSLPVSSTRVGYVPGTHTVGFDSEADTITLVHTARNRQGFAEGAVMAAEWLNGRKGFYDFREIFGSELVGG
jgi:4-hydroxy-tetrahydrodipicolinate reductase